MDSYTLASEPLQVSTSASVVMFFPEKMSSSVGLGFRVTLAPAEFAIWGSPPAPLSSAKWLSKRTTECSWGLRVFPCGAANLGLGLVSHLWSTAKGFRVSPGSQHHMLTQGLACQVGCAI